MNMTAKSWTWQHKGEPTELVLAEKEVRTLGNDEVLIQNCVIGLNPVDWKLIEWGHPEWQPGFVPGVDGMGIILQTGKKMSHLRTGTRVCYHTNLSKDGSFGTHTIVPGHALISVPDKVSDITAAAFPCPSLTAWQAFSKIPHLAGKTVLVSGAGGSVGYFLTQLLLHENAKVYVTASPKHHQEFLQMGVSAAIDYNSPDWKTEMLDSLHGNLFDAAFDTVNGLHASGLGTMLGYYGHLVAIQDRVEQNPVRAFSTCISLHEVALGAYHKYASPKQIAQLIEDGKMLLDKIGAGVLKLRENSVAGFDQLPAHLAEMKRNHSQTKYLVSI
ncbi:NADPH:quinone reductase [Dysgonomonas macrotermitis]|uniref:NADPH:quinone reductase n=2 Tax=Dysgonomonas macrotermitis TaxID=1346286 RepID=A0A1M5ESP4_9BACT|nr:NADPH:quinone reductase [Dysgonomonas macrotermitis]